MKKGGSSCERGVLWAEGGFHHSMCLNGGACLRILWCKQKHFLLVEVTIGYNPENFASSLLWVTARYSPVSIFILGSFLYASTKNTQDALNHFQAKHILLFITHITFLNKNASHNFFCIDILQYTNLKKNYETDQ